MKTLLQTIGLIIAIFLFAYLADQFAPLKQATIYLQEHPQPYRGIAIALTIFGCALLIGSFFVNLWARGRPMAEDEAREFMNRSAGRPTVVRASRGAVAGRTYRGEASFRDIKEAVRTGAWLHDPNIWPFLIALVGVLLAAYGMFGYFVVVGPPVVKLLCVGALAYATARTAWAFWRA